jgi:hypothetical protein
MRYFAVFFFFFVTSFAFAQDTKISATVINDNTLLPLADVSVINLNKVKGTTTNASGYFELVAEVNDTLHISTLGYKSIKVRVTNDWFKTKSTKIKMTEKAYALEEVVINQYNLTGYLEIDYKIIPIKENFRYSISGLSQGYEMGRYSPGAFSKVVGFYLQPGRHALQFLRKKAYRTQKAERNEKG